MWLTLLLFMLLHQEFNYWLKERALTQKHGADQNTFSDKQLSAISRSRDKGAGGTVSCQWCLQNIILRTTTQGTPKDCCLSKNKKKIVTFRRANTNVYTGKREMYAQEMEGGEDTGWALLPFNYCPLSPYALPDLIWDRAVKLNCWAHLDKQSNSKPCCQKGERPAPWQWLQTHVRV